jgi:hypothetical protein
VRSQYGKKAGGGVFDPQHPPYSGPSMDGYFDDANAYIDRLMAEKR